MRRRDVVPVLAFTGLVTALCLVPGPDVSSLDFGRSVRARVLSVDDSGVSNLGLLDFGSEVVTVELLDGPEKGKVFAANNEIRAQLDLDKRFSPGDIALVTIPAGGAKQSDVLVARDHWRNGWSAVLFTAFCIMLIAFGGWTGAKALLSFLLSCLVVWKGVVPLALRGWPASWVMFVAVCLLTAIIMYLVAGVTRKGVSAFLGATLGVFASLGLAHLFGMLMKINGATMPFAQTLLYAGYEHLDLQDVFIGAMVLASSGAVMDLAMDIAAGISEVARHNPELSRRELFFSGVRIGRSVVGTMTTTLLLAYSGGYITLLMVFAAQGTSPAVFLNSTLVSAELVKTLVGSFGLVLVAPFTAIVGALLCGKGPRHVDASSAGR